MLRLVTVMPTDEKPVFPGTSTVFRSRQPFGGINSLRVRDAPHDRLHHLALQYSGRCQRE